MAIVSFSLSRLQSESKVTDVAEAIDMLGMSVESIEGDEIKIDITPNRPDLLDFFGLARAIAYFRGQRSPDGENYQKLYDSRLEINVSDSVKGTRPFIAGIVVEWVNLEGDNLKYLINFTEKIADTYGRRRRKIAIGLHNLDKIEGNLTYEAKDEGAITPLGSNSKESFAEVMKGKKGVKFGGAAQGKPLVLSDSKKAIALIPVTNCEETKVDQTTRNLFIDVTGTFRKAVEDIAALLACSFIDQKAKVSKVAIKYGSKKAETPHTEYKEEKIHLSEIDRTIGAKLSESDLIAISNRLGYRGAKYGDYLLIYIPPYRLDYINSQDVVEDIAIGFGYSNIVPLPVMSSSLGTVNVLTDLTGKIASLMVGLGFDEAMNNYITNDEMQFDSMNIKREPDVVKILYSKTASLTSLRTSIMPSLLANLGISQHEKMPIKLFECGSVFRLDNGKAVEGFSVAFAMEASEANFANVKSYFEALADGIGLKTSIKPTADGRFINGRCAGVFAGGAKIGAFGEIHPAVLKHFGIAEPTVAAEIMLLEEIDYYRD
jgi:phenylalanyl-tRNA synthetase beta chain